MNLSRILLLFAALAVFGSGGLVTSAVLAPPPAMVAVGATVTPTAPPTRSVLAARVDLTRGHLITPEDFVWTEVPETALRPEFYVRGVVGPDRLAGSVVVTTIRQSEVIQRGWIVSPRERGFLSAVLAPGNRAVSLAVDEVSGASGLIFPGDRVDVIVTSQNTGETEDPARQAVGETVLEDVRIIAVGQVLRGPTETAPSEGEQAANRAVARTVTLEVTPDGAQRAAVAATIGRVVLSLRSLQAPTEPGPRQPVPADPVWAGDVMRALADLRPPEPVAPPPTPQAAPAAPEPSRVQVLRGGASR